MSDAPILLLQHPGPVAPARWESTVGHGTCAFRLQLAPGASLHDALVLELGSRGVTAAALNLFGGVFSRVSYCLAAPRAGAPQVAGYTSPTRIDEPVALVAGSATLGRDENGAPLVHCHALLVDPDGNVFGGHIIPEETIVDREAPVVFARSLEGVHVERRFDPETVMAVFHPAATEGGHHVGY